MKKKLNIKFTLFIAFIVAISTSCTKDPYDGLESNERSIEAFNMGAGFTQIGPATVDMETRTVTVKVLMQQDTDLGAVSPNIQTSYKAMVSPASGEKVDFEANGNKITYTVTSESGKTKDWTIEVEPFTETITGTYKITDLVVYGGTGPEYGGDAVLKMLDKPWNFSASDGPQAEMDNTLVFELTGATPEGHTYGKFINNAGTDGKYANFIFTASPVKDINSFYRKMPKGEGVWTRNYADNTVTFTFADGSKTVSTFRNAGTLTIASRTKVIADQSFDFVLTGGRDEWDNAATKIYTDYDKFAGNPRRFWIDVKKQ